MQNSKHFICGFFLFVSQQFEPIHDDEFVNLQNLKFAVSPRALIKVLTMQCVVGHSSHHKLKGLLTSRAEILNTVVSF